MADGPAIQASRQRALAAGMTLAKTLAMVSEFREDDEETPVILMGYFNPIYQYGSLNFVEDALTAGVDGLIIVDLPPEEDDELSHPAMTAGLHWIRLVTPAPLGRLAANQEIDRLAELGFQFWIGVHTVQFCHGQRRQALLVHRAGPGIALRDEDSLLILGA